MDPSRKMRVGYLLEMEGLGMQGSSPPYLTSDPAQGGLQVFTPYNVANNATNYKGVTSNLITDSTKPILQIKAVGMIKEFFYGGAAGDPLCIRAYISAENQMQLKAKLQTSLQSTSITKLAWWIISFDETSKVWFEESYPISHPSITAQINAVNGKDIKLFVRNEAEKIASNIDVNVYEMYFEVVPAANATYVLQFASSSKTKYVRGWGLQVGKHNLDALPVT
jgi:hypothetical protein